MRERATCSSGSALGKPILRPPTIRTLASKRVLLTQHQEVPTHSSEQTQAQGIRPVPTRSSEKKRASQIRLAPAMLSSAILPGRETRLATETRSLDLLRARG